MASMTTRRVPVMLWIHVFLMLSLLVGALVLIISIAADAVGILTIPLGLILLLSPTMYAYTRRERRPS